MVGAYTLVAVVAVIIAFSARLSDAYFDPDIHAPFVDPKQIDVALKKFGDECGANNWPSPWKDRWGNAVGCAWDGNERGTLAPFGCRCLNGGWHPLPPAGDGGLLFMESFGGMANCPQIPREFEAFQMTDFMSLWGNKIKGTLWDTSKQEFLHRLDLSYNEMSGTIPEDFMKINTRHAELINLAYNQFSGTLPQSIATLTILQALRLDNNKFTGQIPADYGKLAQMRHFSVAHNEMSGTVPSLREMSNLARLDLSYNQFSGQLPELPDTITQVDFTGNQFSGSIPESYGKLPLLRNFNCTGCSLTCGNDNLLAHVPISTHCRPKNRAWEQ